MENKVRRPPLVFVLQGILIFFALIHAFNLVVTINASNNRTQPEASHWLLLELAYSSSLIIINVIGVEGMAKRKNYGRWLAVAGFAIPAVLGIYPIYLISARSRFEGIFAVNFLAVSILACLVLLQVVAALYLAFSTPVKIYFGRHIEPLVTDPPPPPSFDDEVPDGK
jgi:hypothetical protein